tara:strand:- start:161 stop:313 length:153 start_codon:yes stop_codon:yes gene_type:complete
VFLDRHEHIKRALVGHAVGLAIDVESFGTANAVNHDAPFHVECLDTSVVE